MSEKRGNHEIKRYENEGIRETASRGSKSTDAISKNDSVPWCDRHQRHSDATAQMHPGYSVGRCRLINKAVFHTKAETMPDLTKHLRTYATTIV